MSLSTFIAYMIGSGRLNKKLLLAFVLVASFYPYHFVLQRKITSEALCIPMILVIVALVMRDSGRWTRTLTGALLGVLILIRPDFIIFSGVLCMWIVGRAYFSKRESLRGIVTDLGLSAAADRADPGPVGLEKNHRITGAWVFSTRASYQLYAHNEGHMQNLEGVPTDGRLADAPVLAGEIARDRYLRQRAIDYLKDNPRVCRC